MNERGRFIRIAITVIVGLFIICSTVSANSTTFTALPWQGAATVARAAAAVLPAVLESSTQASVMKVQDQPAPPAEPSKPDTQVTKTETKETTVWYVSPLWIALIVVGAIALILIIVLAVRGGGKSTTVIRS